MSQLIFEMNLKEKETVNTRHLFTEYSSSSSELNSKNNLFPTFLKLVFSYSNLKINQIAHYKSWQSQQCYLLGSG